MHRPQCTVESQLAENYKVLYDGRLKLFRGKKYSQRNRQIVCRSLFFFVCRRKVDGNTPVGKFEAGIFYGRNDTMHAFFDCIIGKPDNKKSRQSLIELSFHLNSICMNTEGGCALDFRKHVNPC